MSATFPSQDDLRIPPKPRVSARMGFRNPSSLPAQVAGSAVAGFALAWLLARLIIG